MRFIIFFSFLSVAIVAQSPAEKLIDQSIKFHDPNGAWKSFSAEIHISSVVDRKGKIDSSERLINLDLANDYFKMTQDTLVYETPCEECERAQMYNRYFRYLLGMPMKLKDEGIVIQGNIDLAKYKEVEYQVVTATYAPEVGTDTWKFYFKPETAELNLMEFSKDGTFQNGETIELNEKTKFQGMLLPGQLLWLVLPDRHFLAKEDIIYKKWAK